MSRDFYSVINNRLLCIVVLVIVIVIVINFNMNGIVAIGSNSKPFLLYRSHDLIAVTTTTNK